MVFIEMVFVGRVLKPPNRKKHEEDVSQCNGVIQGKENQLVSTACEFSSSDNTCLAVVVC